ncbi:unnamed protein product [Effrenium voratum]|nr:unnamed protein product [Effrenium voratum]
MFQIRVSSETRVHFMWQRFNAFKHLADYLRHRFPSLPSVKRIGRFWQKALHYRKFLQVRQRTLTIFLQAALAADPEVEDVVLREFLGIPYETCEMLPRDAEEEMQALPEPVTSRGRACSSADKFVQPHHTYRPTSWIGDFRPDDMFDPDEGPVQRCLSSPQLEKSALEDEEASRVLAQDDRFNGFAVVIARDVSRVFASHQRIHHVRLEIAEVLRAYAREDPDLGYTQGMCFAAAVVCMGNGNLESKHKRFGGLMRNLRDLWMPGFPLVERGVPAVEAMLASKDPELLHHLYHEVKLDLGMVVPGAWLSVFGKWLPVDILEDLVPFLEEQGVAGFVVVTFLMLLAHRCKLLAAHSLEEILPRINSLSNEPPPEQLLNLCQVSMSQLRTGRDSMSWVATM